MQFEPKEKEYNQYVETITPVSNSARNCLWAFLIGGLICTIGQVLCIDRSCTHQCGTHRSECL